MTGSVLVVEDDAAIRDGILALLEVHGYRSVAASTVAEAASQLDAATPTHLLLDLNLPDGAGTSILRRIRAESLFVRVALVTGATDSALLDEARSLGVDAIFTKPPDWDNLLDWIAQL